MIDRNQSKISAWISLFAITAMVFYFTMLASLEPALAVLGTWENIDKWFDADIFRVLKVETDALHKAHHRNNVHPFFSLVTFPIVSVLTDVIGLHVNTAIRVAHSAWAALLASTMFIIVLREVRNQALALGITCLGCSSASFIFWTTVPESFVLGALSISLVMLVHNANKPKSFQGWVVTNLISFSITITNLSASVISMFLQIGICRIVKILAVSLIFAIAIALVQRWFFPQSGLFFLSLQKEAGYVGLTHKTAPQLIFILLNRATTFIFSGFVLPGFSVYPGNSPGDLNGLVAESILRSNISLLQLISLIGWWVLLSIGIFKTVKNWKNEGVAKLALLFLAGQFALHLVYGEHTFLYVLHSLPAVLVIIGCALRSTKSTVLILVLLFAFAASLSTNLELFFKAKQNLTTM